MAGKPMSFSCVQWRPSFPQDSESQCVVLNTQTVLHGVEKANLESGEKGSFVSRCAGKLGKALESRPRDEDLGTHPSIFSPQSEAQV